MNNTLCSVWDPSPLLLHYAGAAVVSGGEVNTYIWGSRAGVCHSKFSSAHGRVGSSAQIVIKCFWIVLTATWPRMVTKGVERVLARVVNWEQNAVSFLLCVLVFFFVLFFLCFSFFTMVKKKIRINLLSTTPELLPAAGRDLYTPGSGRNARKRRRNETPTHLFPRPWPWQHWLQLLLASPLWWQKVWIPLWRHLAASVAIFTTAIHGKNARSSGKIAKK